MRFTNPPPNVQVVPLPKVEGSYTVKECAEYFCVTEECVYKWIRNGKLKGAWRYQDTRKYMIPRNAIPILVNMSKAKKIASSIQS